MEMKVKLYWIEFCILNYFVIVLVLNVWQMCYCKILYVQIHFSCFVINCILLCFKRLRSFGCKGQNFFFFRCVDVHVHVYAFSCIWKFPMHMLACADKNNFIILFIRSSNTSYWPSFVLTTLLLLVCIDDVPYVFVQIPPSVDKTLYICHVSPACSHGLIVCTF